VAEIPALANDTDILYRIYAYDENGNSAVSSQYDYTVYDEPITTTTTTNTMTTSTSTTTSTTNTTTSSTTTNTTDIPDHDDGASNYRYLVCASDTHHCSLSS
jgi:hypothetical protein